MENLRSSSAARYRPLPPSTALYRPCFRTNTVPRKELFAGAPHIRPVAHQPRRRRQAFEDHRAVALRNHAAVQQHDRRVVTKRYGAMILEGLSFREIGRAHV